MASARSTYANSSAPGPIDPERYPANVAAPSSAEMERRRIGTEGRRRAIVFPAPTLVGDNPHDHTPRDTIEKVNLRKALATVEQARDILWHRLTAID